MTTKNVSVKIYVADDGKEFKTPSECKRHEMEVKNKRHLELEKIADERVKLIQTIQALKYPCFIFGSGGGNKFHDAEVELAEAKLAVQRERHIRRPNKQKLRVVAPLLMRLLNARNNLADLKTRYKEARAALEKNRQERNQLIQEINKEGQK